MDTFVGPMVVFGQHTRVTGMVVPRDGVASSLLQAVLLPVSSYCGILAQ